MSDDTKPEGFSLGKPAIVCRWRLASRRVPMLNRHIRALSERTIGGSPVSRNLISWAKQHIEWSLAEDATVDADGVLMIVIDTDGHAAMSTGPYEPLPDVSVPALAARARSARAEEGECGVAPEALCLVRDGALVIGAREGSNVCGTLSLVEQLARTRRIGVSFDEDAAEGIMPHDGVILVSDEHGVVLAGEGCHPAEEDLEVARFLSDGVETLRSRASDLSRGR